MEKTHINADIMNIQLKVEKKEKDVEKYQKKNYDGLNDYIDATKKSNQLANLNINCYSESNSKYLQNYKKIIISMLSLILLFL